MIVSARDKDILVILVHHNERLSNKEVYFPTKTGETKRYVNLKLLANHLGSDICETLPLCHRVSGCDSTSQHYGIAKKTALDTLKSNHTLLKISKEYPPTPATRAQIMVFTCRLFGDNTTISTDTIRQVGLMKCSK